MADQPGRWAEWRARFGPWAVVTGASDGIGRATAVALAERGIHLVLAARRQAVLDDVARTLGNTYGVEAIAVPVDLASPDGVQTLVDRTTNLDVGLLVAAAGFGTSGPLASGDIGREQQMLAVNCAAVLQLAHAFARRLSTRGRGGIVLLSSIVAFQGVPRAAHYAATKAYVQSLAEGLRRELAPAGVDVLASAPGPVPSGFGAVANMRITGGVAPERVARETLDALGRRGTVRPGLQSRLLGAALATLPRALRVRVLEQVMAGMTRHQTS